MIQEPECSKRNCIHFLGVINDGDETTERPYCRAYPNGIPNEIAYGDDKHLEVRDDQSNEIIFESVDE